MSFNNILVSQNDGIATITINRPDKMNALNIETIKEIGEAFQNIEKDDSIFGIILTGAGEKAFAAGADIAEFSSFTPSQAKEMSENGHYIFNALENSPKPVIAAVNGFALGGGCELAMACHIRICSENARFGQPEVNLGLLPGYGGTQRLVQLIGKGRALEYLMTADMINAEKALDFGLANKVTPQEELLSTAKEMLKKIRTKSPQGIGKTINCVNSYFDESKNGFHEEIREFSTSFGTEDFTEGVSAFLEKRKPEF